MLTLIESFKQIPDFRKARGKSHPLWVLLLLIVMGMLAGYQGYRPLHPFAHEHQPALCNLFGLEQLKVPSHSTFRRVMMGVDFVSLSNSFEAWMLSQRAVHSRDSDVVAIDGKRIRQPLTDANSKHRFVGLVSLFAVETGLSIKLEGLTQHDNSELKVVQTLLETLEMEGLLITMDALHAQKNASADYCLG
jgi:hypothetical protein